MAKHSGVVRTEQCRFRKRPAGVARIKAAAATKGLSISEYLRTVVGRAVREGLGGTRSTEFANRAEGGR